MSFFKLKDYIQKSEDEAGFVEDEIARFGRHLPVFAKVRWKHFLLLLIPGRHNRTRFLCPMSCPKKAAFAVPSLTFDFPPHFLSS